MAIWRLVVPTLMLSAIACSSEVLSADLTVEVTGVRAGGGKIVFDLWRQGSDATRFPSFGSVPESKTNGKTGARSCDWTQGRTSICRQSVVVSGTSVSYTFRGLPNDKYAVSVFHDKDASWDANPGPPFNVPKEGYGVSVESGPPPLIPDFDSAKLSIDGTRSISIQLIYR